MANSRQSFKKTSWYLFIILILLRLYSVVMNVVRQSSNRLDFTCVQILLTLNLFFFLSAAFSYSLCRLPSERRMFMVLHNLLSTVALSNFSSFRSAIHWLKHVFKIYTESNITGRDWGPKTPKKFCLYFTWWKIQLSLFLKEWRPTDIESSHLLVSF